MVAVPGTRLGTFVEGSGIQMLRVGLDVLALLMATAVTMAWSGLSVGSDTLPLLLFCPLAIAALALRHTYDRRLRTLFLDSIGPVAGAISFAAMGVVVLDVLRDGTLEAGVMVRAYAIALALVFAGRASVSLLERWARTRGLSARPTLIVGAGAVGAQMARRLVAAPEYGLLPVGFLDDDPPSETAVGDRLAPVLGGPADLAAAAEQTGARNVLLAFSHAPDQDLLPTIRHAEALGLEVSLVPRMFESMNDRVIYDPLGGLPLLGLRRTNPRGWQFTVKHTLDRLLAALLLFALLPALAAIALSVKLSSPGSVLFRQRRVGRDGRSFDLLKFRTMTDDGVAPRGFAPGVGAAPGGVEGTDRRTRAGRLLRRTSLDELPQLLNVLKGEMSLVGPRPERPEFVELFSADLRRYEDRHRVKSGMTGWAQVHGLRGQTSLADRVELDNFYIEHWSLALDWKILARTFLAVLRSAE
ncbi:MAG: exopolysaccharide biosynthesis polyprenyl glycosylphosphotransferase [Solirubrobacteraceae bacterium]|nr:exopolysaccharide biosynthesis polyprenyl glycosylphosphotransferase [Solirubrobacteraceae bacterium]